MTVKSDSKGRVSIGRAGEEYHLSTDPTGRVALTPTKPREVTTIREVDQADFEEVFGIPVNLMVVDGIHTYQLNTEQDEFLPNGILVESFVSNGDGGRVIRAGEVLKEYTLIRIRKSC